MSFNNPTIEVNPCLAKPLLKFKGSLATIGLTYLVEQLGQLWPQLTKNVYPSI